MRLITQNLLMCNNEGCAGRNHKLSLQAAEITEGASEYNQNLVIRMLSKIDWPSFTSLASTLGHDLPENITEEDYQNTDLMQRIFNIMFNIDIQTGSLSCQNCERVYPIDKGIPNLLLQS